MTCKVVPWGDPKPDLNPVEFSPPVGLCETKSPQRLHGGSLKSQWTKCARQIPRKHKKDREKKDREKNAIATGVPPFKA